MQPAALLNLIVLLFKREFHMNRLRSPCALLVLVLVAASLGCDPEPAPPTSPPAPQSVQPKPNREQQPTEPSGVTLYDPDPNPLWNHLHQALYVKLTASVKGEPILSIWPGDGEVRVEKDGVDVFDLIQRASESHPAYQQHEPSAFAEPAAAADGPPD